MNPKISVIIPTYNPEDYLCVCPTCKKIATVAKLTSGKEMVIE